MNGKGLMRVLCGMLVVAAVLAVASLAMVRPATATSASPPRPLGCRISQCTEWYFGPCHSCGNFYKQWVRWCRVCDVCYGICWPWQLESICVPCY